MKISLQNVSKAYGGRDLFNDLSLEVNEGMRLAVAGPNGAGKSTLIRIMAADEPPDSGRVIHPRGSAVGHSAQELDESDLDSQLLEWVLDALPSWGDFWREWDRAAADGDKKALERLSHRQAELEQSFGYNPEARAKAVLGGLGFEQSQLTEKIIKLSGGWRERAKLARVLTGGASILLLDEPTNHLDLEAVEWLEGYLKSFEGALAFVAHDRVFLDRVSTHVLYLGQSKASLRKGSFSQFIDWQEEQEEQRKREEKHLQAEMDKKLDFVRRFHAKATKARQSQAKKKQAQKLAKELEGVRPEAKRKTLSFSWPEPPRGNSTPLSVVDLSAGWPGGEPLWEPLNFQVYDRQRIALAGPNGCGKSTLLKVIVGEKRPDKGRVEIGSNMVVGYFSQHVSDALDLTRTVIAEIRRLADPKTSEEQLRSVLGLFMLGEGYFDRKVGELSGGEKNRLVLASLFLARANLLVLDEPTNHLDLESREALIKALNDFEGTVLMVAHDRHLLRTVAEQVWALGRDGFEVFDDFDEYEKNRFDAGFEEEEPKEAPGHKAVGSREDLKALKRRQAEERNRIYRDLKPKKAEYEKLEADLEEVLAEQSEVEQALADPDTYADSEKSSRLLKKFSDLKERSEKMFLKMGELEEEIAELERRRKELSAA
jgi:ATP-binding cassette subfamily F protein 3